MPGTHENTSTRTLLERKKLRRSDRLAWWYRFSAPPESISAGSFIGRERYRQGRLISTALLLQLILTIILLVTIGFFVNHTLITCFVIVAALLLVAALLNRRGRVLYAGMLAVAAVDLAMLFNIASYHVISSLMLPLFDLLALPELIAGSLLPPRAIFIDAAFHICFIVAALTFLFPQSAELSALLQTSGMLSVLIYPTLMQIMVAAIAYFWLKNTAQAVKRADQATSIAMLEQEMAEQGVLVAEKKRQLEESVRQIVAVHMQVANGDYAARVPLGEGNALWEIAGPLNILLNRLQRYRRDSQVLGKTNEAVNRFLQARGRAGNGLVAWRKTSTSIDSVVQQHNNLVRSAQSMPRSDQPVLHDPMP